MRTAVIYNFLIEAGIIASIAILLMIPVRKYFRKYLGNKALCFAWLLVAIRLLCPLSLPNPIIHEIQTPFNYDQSHIRPIAGQVQVRLRNTVDQWQSRAYAAVAASGTQNYWEDPSVQWVNRLDTSMYNGKMSHALMYVYGAGVLAVAGWFIVSNARFRRRLKKDRIETVEGELRAYYERLCGELKIKPLPIYRVDPLPGACLAGVFRPCIALPAAAETEDAKQMLLHEAWHQKARDPWWSVLQLVCCAVHWFNPLVWLAASMSRTDRELKCDDNVTRAMNDAQKQAYAKLLVQSAGRRSMPALPVLATGMSMPGRKLKTRVASILRSGRKILALAWVFTVVSSLLLVCAFATSDVGQDQRIDLHLTATSGFNHKYDWYSHMDVSEQKLSSVEKALAYAKELWRGKYLQQDVSAAKWNAVIWDMDDYPMYHITATLADTTELWLNLLPDGAVDYLFVDLPAIGEENPKNPEASPLPVQTAAPDPTVTPLPLAAPDPAASPMPMPSTAPAPSPMPSRDDLLFYLEEAAEAMESGVMAKVTNIDMSEVYDYCGFPCVHVEMTVFGEDDRLVTIQCAPILRLLEYGTGNG